MRALDLRARMKAAVREADELQRSEAPRAVAEALREAGFKDAAVMSSTVTLECFEDENPALVAKRDALLADLEAQFPAVPIIIVRRLRARNYPGTLPAVTPEAPSPESGAYLSEVKRP